MPKEYNIGVVGATGLVGRTMLKVLEERNFPMGSLHLFASDNSAGKSIDFNGNSIKIEKLTARSFDKIDIALFSAGAFVSQNFATIAADADCVVIDNGSYWRMNKDVPLVIPEINPDTLRYHHGIIANPNCSTIILALPLNTIHHNFDIESVYISTYQAISGGGQKMLDKYHNEMNGIYNDKHPIFNTIMLHSDYNEHGRTIEEEKMVNETHKILAADFPVIPTCVRIPVEVGHCESATIKIRQHTDIEAIKKILEQTKGITLLDDSDNEYPTPLMCSGRDEVFVGRIRIEKNEHGSTLSLWVVGDNLRKGAATNAVQIAECLVGNNLLSFNKIKFN